jgi:uncharacterized protein YbbC (DUF1343 family)
MVYPGQVIWEGTNISEGRGTTLPFELFGAPFISPAQLMETIDRHLLDGAILRPVIFEPTAGKWSGQSCHGFQIHITDDTVFSAYSLALGMYQAIFQLYPEQFAYKQPPYEYEYERLPMDLILGDRKARTDIESGIPIADIQAGWAESLSAYREMIAGIYLY